MGRGVDEIAARLTRRVISARVEARHLLSACSVRQSRAVRTRARDSSTNASSHARSPDGHCRASRMQTGERCQEFRPDGSDVLRKGELARHCVRFVEQDLVTRQKRSCGRLDEAAQKGRNVSTESPESKVSEDLALVEHEAEPRIDDKTLPAGAPQPVPLQHDLERERPFEVGRLLDQGRPGARGIKPTHHCVEVAQRSAGRVNPWRRQSIPPPALPAWA
jgi:hypothetical protein